MQHLKRMMAVASICFLMWEPALVSAQQSSRANHPWGRFKPGAWKRLRLLTETLDEKGNVASSTVTETTTTLESVSDTEYVLRVDVAVEVAGKRITSEPQTVRQGYNGESEGQKVTVKRVGEGGVSISGQTYPIEVREVVVNGGNTKRISTIHYSEKVSPFVLKRDTRSSDAEGKVTHSQTQVEVLAIDMPFRVLDETRNVSFVRTIHKQGKGSAITLETHCNEVPGGVVSHTSKEEDETGRTIRRSTLELVDFGLTTNESSEDSSTGRRRIFHRNRGRTSDQSVARERAKLS